MKALEKLQQYISNLEEKKLNLFIGLACAIVTALGTLIILNYYRRAAALREEITFINEQRTRVKRLLTAYEHVRKHRADVDALFSQEEGFKIEGYFLQLLAMLGLSDKKGMTTPSHIDHDKYRESILKAELTDMNMKQLCELLSALDQNKRIYTKELEITKSKTAQKAINVALTIATLEPRSAITT